MNRAVWEERACFITPRGDGRVQTGLRAKRKQEGDTLAFVRNEINLPVSHGEVCASSFGHIFGCGLTPDRVKCTHETRRAGQ